MSNYTRIKVPADFNLPHDTFRPHQLDSIQWIHEAKRGVIKVTEQSTGSGKSTIAMAQSMYGQVVVLTKTKQLQRQYESEFKDAVALFGRNNYPCVHPSNSNAKTAMDCLYTDNMHECPFANNCEYLITKMLAHTIDRTILNYAYWLTTYGKWQPEYLVLDEAHNLSDVVLNFVGSIINYKEVEHWQLPVLPNIRKLGSSAVFKQVDTYGQALQWLLASRGRMDQVVAELTSKGDTDYWRKERADAEELANKIKNTIEALHHNPGDHWYIASGADATTRGAGFICKPKTARYDAPRFFFTKQERVLAMSATIGNVEAFTTEVGIKDYEFRCVPNQWPAASRQIEILDAPNMGKSSTEANPKAWEQQADIIANKIKELPPHWSGLILCTRKKEVLLLTERLAKRGLEKRVYAMASVDGTYIPSQEQVAAWNAKLKKKPNSIGISCNLWEGYDGKDINFVIIAKTPYPFQSPYERARIEYDGKFYLQRTAYTMEQGLGRCRRGERSDYNIDGEFNTYVAIADGGWNRIKNYFPESIKDALIGA